MSCMFLNCPNFNQKLKFDTKNVVTMEKMFANLNIKKLEKENMADRQYSNYLFNQEINFNTPNLKNTSFMFYGCYDFNSNVFLSDTSKVEDMAFMFSNCINFNKNIKFDTSRVKTMRYMFAGCSSLHKLQSLSIPTAVIKPTAVVKKYVSNTNSSSRLQRL